MTAARPRTKARGAAAGRRKPKMPETSRALNRACRKTAPPRFRGPAAEPLAEGPTTARSRLQRAPDGVLHGFQGILGARPVGAAALSDVVFAASATSEGLAGDAYQIACVQTAITGAAGSSR